MMTKFWRGYALVQITAFVRQFFDSSSRACADRGFEFPSRRPCKTGNPALLEPIKDRS
jgi:hypothetical protein